MITENGTTIDVGTIFHASFGYSMVLNDWYQVVKVTSKTVVVRELETDIVSGDFFRGTETCVPNKFKDYSNMYCSGRKQLKDGTVVFEKRCVVDGTKNGTPCIKIGDYKRAYIWDGTPKMFDRLD